MLGRGVCCVTSLRHCRIYLFNILCYLLYLCGSDFFSVPLFIFCPTDGGRKRFEHTVLNFLIGSAMLAIWLTSKNKAVCFDPILVISVTFFLHVVSRLWSVGGVWCSMGQVDVLF